MKNLIGWQGEDSGRNYVLKTMRNQQISWLAVLDACLCIGRAVVSYVLGTSGAKKVTVLDMPIMLEAGHRQF